MEILKGSNNHIELCLEIVRQLPDFFTGKAIQKIKMGLENHNFYIAIFNQELTGFIAIQLKTEDVAELLWVAVHPKHQKKGIGSNLVNSIINILKDLEVKILEVKTLSENVNYKPYEVARIFYKKLGFIHLETIDPYPTWDPENPCAIYIKIL